MARINQVWRHNNGFWTYPDSGKVLEEVGLFSIAHYVQVRRQTVAKYVVGREIFRNCVDGQRRSGPCSYHHH